MKILGMTHPWSYNSSACLLVDGELVGFMEEERLSRVKHGPRIFPRLSIDWLLERAGLSWEELDAVAVPHCSLGTLVSKNLALNPSLRFKLASNVYLGSLWAYHTARLRWFLRNNKQPVHFLRHNLCHAASTYYAGGFPEANVLSLDGTGGENAGVMAFGHDGGMEVLREIPNQYSLGYLYNKVTEALGFRPHSDEYKVMGLASYGEPDPGGFPFVDLSSELPRIDPVGLHRYCWKWRYTLDIKNPLSEGCTRLAATLQRTLEMAVIKIIRYMTARTGCNNLCMSGGVSLNCAMNRHIADLPEVKNLYVQPLSLDSGTSVGAAFLLHKELTESPPLPFPETVYFGPAFSSREMEEALTQAGVAYRVSENVAHDVALLLRDGKIVGWFQGKMEAGPRALGDRSILADPRDTRSREIVNRKVKNREPWRPFAVSILEEKASSFFRRPGPFPHMTVAVEVLPDKRDSICAGVHVDGTTRPQTVTREENPLYHELLCEFEKLTGIPALLNTSFNLNDEPIVCRPKEAVRCFLRSGLDFLVIGNFVAGK